MQYVTRRGFNTPTFFYLSPTPPPQVGYRRHFLTMFNLLFVVGSFAALLGFTVAYPHQKRYESMESTVNCYDYPAPMSYHVHVTYMLTNDNQIDQVSALRDEAQAHFAPFLGSDPVCQGTKDDPSGRYGTVKYFIKLLPKLPHHLCPSFYLLLFIDNGRICMIYDHNITNDTLGPFAVGEWSKWRCGLIRFSLLY